MRTTRGTTNGVPTLQFSPTDDQLAATDGLREIVTWSIADAKSVLADPVAVACNLVHEGLTEIEWERQLRQFDYRATC
ncbi:hypothetical protein GCM10027184_16880 [Saccharothrix stipae]